MKKVTKFLVLSILAILAFNLTAINAYIIFVNPYENFNLFPGEKYILNIPFFGPSLSPTVCGTAQTTAGKLLSGVNVSAYDGTDLIDKATTNYQGKYCLDFPEISSKRDYIIAITYNNDSSSPLTLASNDYDFSFEDKKIYSKASAEFAVLSGEIKNEDAKIENGRIEVNLKYYNYTNATSYKLIDIFEYVQYFVNINPQETYDFPNDELNITWPISLATKTGRYKWGIKPSFNGEEKTAMSVYFNITA